MNLDSATSTIEHVMLAGSLLLLLSVLLSKLSGRLGLPALLIFVAIGMLAGSEGPGGIAFANYGVTQAIGILALALILFDGGMSTQWQQVKPIARAGLALSSVGVLLSAALVSVAVRYLLSMSWTESLLLGAIVSATDAAAVFGILRTRGGALRGRSQPLLEFESGSNDPMAVFLTVGIVTLLTHSADGWSGLAPLFAKQAVLGAAFGYAGGVILPWAINRVSLSFEGLYPVLTVAAVPLLYSATAMSGGSGFLAVYMAALMLGQREFIHKKSLFRFHSGIAWIMQISMFLTLGLVLFPSDLVPVAVPGTLLAFWLILVARPVSVFMCLAWSSFSMREKLLISWVGLRGATPIILATFPLLAGLQQADKMFNVVFFVVIISALIQGTTVTWVAKRLGLYESEPSYEGPKIELGPGYTGPTRVLDVTVSQTSSAAGRPLVAIGLPQGVLVTLVTRGERHFIPQGDTILEPGDHITLLTGPEHSAEVRARFESESTNPHRTTPGEQAKTD